MSESPRSSRRVATDRTIIRHARRRGRSAVVTALKVVSGALAVVLVSGGAVAAYALWDVASSVKPAVTLAGQDGSVPNIDAIEGGVNLLLVGSDSRQGQGDAYGDPDKETGVLNDVTMLLHISEDHSSASVVSFPRDLFVPIPECPKVDGSGTYNAMSSQKINTTLSYGGLACTVLTVEALTGLDIPFAAEVQFNGVIALSNAVGGVDVCVAEPISDDYTQTYLDAGTHNLQGEDALQFLRTRHGVGDGSDLGRISNQQVFLSSLARTLQSSETLSDPTKLFGIAKAAASNMQLSTSLQNINTMVSIAMAMKDIPLEQISFVQYPNAYGSSGGQQGVLPLTDAATQLFDAIKADRPLTLTGTTGEGSVEDPNAPAAGETPAPEETAPPEETTPPEDGGAETTPPATAGGDEAVELPSSIEGQTAGDYTCSKGNG
ncbi:LCP family protein [Labedella endophytica]|uniref:LytR family transcriptional regulator n=1 Tax=Labedella endophytica TaxID=1523160 RepID=A0A3S0VH43_9MICO|nr:LCP family protein [Labedella endophytica]RUR01770.1 LytR family transcriptional regulator [Labedella endophytica]